MNDHIFEIGTATLRFGATATLEVGAELADQGIRRVMLVTDANLRSLPPVQRALESLEKEKIRVEVFDKVRIEPTERSFQEAILFAKEHSPEAFVAVGGGSSIDTAKAANLYSTHPAEFLDYVYPPLGKGKPIPGPLKPLIAIPTTAGTGSETTGVAIFDFEEAKVKTALAHRKLKPSLAIVDPENTRTLPPSVAAATGLDVLSHAIESYTALDYRRRPKPLRPSLRTTYQGANPISDVWAKKALQMVYQYLKRAVFDPEDDEARGQMLLAASFAGIGFGNAGVHLPHAMSYPVSGLCKNYRPAGYKVDRPLIPHGVSVILCAPAAFRFTASGCPERHLDAAEILGANVAGKKEADAGLILADQIQTLIESLGLPPALSSIGYNSGDIPALVKGTLPQSRITQLSPRPVSPEDLAMIFEDALGAR